MRRSRWTSTRRWRGAWRCRPTCSRRARTSSATRGSCTSTRRRAQPRRQAGPGDLPARRQGAIAVHGVEQVRHAHARAIGLAIVDESVFALQEVHPASRRSTSRREGDMKPRYEIHGYELNNWSSDPWRSRAAGPAPKAWTETQQRAAQVLLASAPPAPDPPVRIDTFAQKAAASRQAFNERCGKTPPASATRRGLLPEEQGASGRPAQGTGAVEVPARGGPARPVGNRYESTSARAATGSAACR